ncbi:MAG TPA: hypothetical protein VIJ27_13840 [Mucilaginibacter sp.]
MKPLSVDISNDALNIIIGLATLIIALISFGTEIGKYKTFKFLKSLSFRIPVLLIFSIVIIWSTVIKDKNNDIKNSNDIEIRDSINQKKFNESLSKTSSSYASSTSQTMAKYYLKYDSTQHKIEKAVGDSIQNVSGKNLRPFIEIYDIKSEQLLDTVNIKTFLHSSQGVAKKLNFRYCNVVRIGDALQFVNQAFKTPQLSANITSDPFYFEYKLSGDLKSNPIFYICIYGDYEDANEKIRRKPKKYSLLTIKSFNLKSYSFAALTVREYSWIYSFIIKNGIKLPKG